jgi:hypothetical protein
MATAAQGKISEDLVWFGIMIVMVVGLMYLVL